MANNSGKILLVEGDNVDRDFLNRTLEDAGFEVYPCETAREARGIISVVSPALVISNLHLPDTSGWDFYKEIRGDSEGPKIPFVLLGNREEVGERIQAYRLGIEDIIYKPFNAEELINKIVSVLKGSSAIEQEESYPTTEEGIRGRIKDMGLPDLLQILNMSNKTAQVYLSHTNGQEGKIFVENGEVVHAKCGDLAGEDAIYHLLTWSDGDFDVEPDVPSPMTSINTTVENLLLEGMKKIDEEARDSEVGEGKNTLSEEDPESFKVVKKLFELGILEKK